MALGVGRYIGFAHESSFLDYREDLNIFSKCSFQLFTKYLIFLKLHVLSYRVFLVPVFLVFFPFPVENNVYLV